MIKQKQCKGTGLAIGYGCGKLTTHRVYGLGKMCCYSDWLLNSDNGKIKLAKSIIHAKKETKKANNAFKTDLRNKLKTLSQLESEAKTEFQKWIRTVRDVDLPCISCNTIKNVQYSGGHYFPAGIYSGLIFDERNVHKQCNNYCNKQLSGNLIAYRMGLVNRYGLEFVEQLETDSNLKRDKKYTKDELIEIKRKYQKLNANT